MSTKEEAVSLAEALPLEQARCRALLADYKEIGPAVAFGASLIERSLRVADTAASSGNVLEMLAAYQDLKSLE